MKPQPKKYSFREYYLSCISLAFESFLKTIKMFMGYWYCSYCGNFHSQRVIKYNHFLFPYCSLGKKKPEGEGED